MSPPSKLSSLSNNFCEVTAANEAAAIAVARAVSFAPFQFFSPTAGQTTKHISGDLVLSAARFPSPAPTSIRLPIIHRLLV